MNILLLLLIVIPLSSAQPLNADPQDRDPNEFCKKCWERRNQKDYYANEFNCTTYYHCFKNGSRIEGILRPCASGLRFDEHILACVPMISPGRCDDPCSDPDTMMTGWWQDTTLPQQGCGLFYQCSNYYSIKMCCPPDHRFNVTWGDCMWDPSCNHHNDECGKQSITVPMWTPRAVDAETCDDVQYGVRRRVVQGDPSKYIVVLPPPHDQVERDCPPATHFDLNTCKCSIHANFTATPRFQECFLDVTGKEKTIIDQSHMKFWIDTGRVKTLDIGNDAYSIDCPGDRHVEVTGLQGLSIGDSLTVMAWIRPKCTKNEGIIFSNRGEGMDLKPSIEFVEEVVEEVDNPTTGRVRMTIRTVQASYSRSFPISCNFWNFAAVSYDGMTFTFFVNAGGVLTNQMEDVPVETWEEIIYWMVHCPLSICQNINDVNGNHEFIGYDGEVDRIRVCRSALTKQELQTTANDESPVPYVVAV